MSAKYRTKVGLCVALLTFGCTAGTANPGPAEVSSGGSAATTTGGGVEPGGPATGGNIGPVGSATGSGGSGSSVTGSGTLNGGGGGNVSNSAGGGTAAGGSATVGGGAGLPSGGETQGAGGSGAGMSGGPSQQGGTSSAGTSAGGSAGAPPVRMVPANALHGELFPFPQNITYPLAIRSNNITNEHVQSWYDAWKQKYLIACGNNLRTGGANYSLVEAVGFGMVAAAYMGDKPTVDALYGFYDAKVTSSGCNLMGWQATCEGWGDQGSATDGDIDVASGLIVAHWQWPSDGYDIKANEIITNLKEMIVDCDGTSALYPGCSGGNPWGGCNETDASYYSPAFFRYFAEISGDPAWTKLADDSHVIRDAAANDSTGLVPDWQSVDGRAGSNGRAGHYGFDAIRTPYKHGLDFLFHGNEAARAWCEKISTWANGVGASQLRDGYQLNGSPQGSNHNLAVTGSLAVCAMANTQDVIDAFTEEAVRLSDDHWYSGYLGNLYLLALSGNMWVPSIVPY